MTEKPMSVYLNETWVHQEGRYWIAKAIAFSKNDNDLTICACHNSRELAYQRLVSGMKELRLVPDNQDELNGSPKPKKPFSGPPHLT